MGTPLMTAVSATVDVAREEELVSGFRELISGGLPEMILRSELLRGRDGTWRIQTLWRDYDALMGARGSGERPAALELFERLGADHAHEVFTVEASHERA
jgi:hypothetical protein